jgi:hypothetical protein
LKQSYHVAQVSGELAALLPQPPQWMRLQACVTTPDLQIFFSNCSICRIFSRIL